MTKQKGFVIILIVVLGILLFYKSGLLGTTIPSKTPLIIKSIESITLSNTFFIDKYTTQGNGKITFLSSSVTFAEYTYPSNSLSILSSTDKSETFSIIITYGQTRGENNYIDMTYNNGKKIRLYIPDFGVGSSGFLNLWFSDDGSSYYDLALAKLAVASKGQPFACIESWSCTSFNYCTNNQQTRTCTDVNNCGTIVNKPIEIQSCTIVCTPDWQCTQWGNCFSNQQTRTCTDVNNCGILSNKPSESQYCSLTCVTNPQLLSYISDWIISKITNQQLLSYIGLWTKC